MYMILTTVSYLDLRDVYFLDRQLLSVFEFVYGSFNDKNVVFLLIVQFALKYLIVKVSGHLNLLFFL